MDPAEFDGLRERLAPEVVDQVTPPSVDADTAIPCCSLHAVWMA